MVSLEDEAGLAGLRNLRVMSVCGGGDDAGLNALLAAGRRDLGWRVELAQLDMARAFQRQSFEDDSNAVAGLDAFIGDCERASGVPSGRIVLAGAHDIGRGFYAADLSSIGNGPGHRFLADNSEPFRVVRRMFAQARDLVSDCQPDLVVFAGRPEPWYFVFQLVARQGGIRTLALRRSQVWDMRCYWSDLIDGHNSATDTVAAKKRSLQAPVSIRAQEHVALHRGADLASPGRSHARPDRPFQSFASEDLANIPYVYLALKEEPSDRLDSQSSFWANQYYVAELVCTTIPSGYRLLVQDHPRNMGRRPPQFYRDMSHLPGLILISGSDDSSRYIAHAGLIVTDNGPAGWQALLRGRPVVALADSFFQGADIARRVRDPEQLAVTVIDAVSPSRQRGQSDDSRKLGWFIDAEWETTSPVESEREVLALLGAALRVSALRSKNVATRAEAAAAATR